MKAQKDEGIGPCVTAAHLYLTPCPRASVQRRMDADYLKLTVGDALAEALTSVAMKQPKDPVDFVGKYLISYADYLEAETKVSFQRY